MNTQNILIEDFLAELDANILGPIEATHDGALMSLAVLRGHALQGTLVVLDPPTAQTFGKYNGQQAILQQRTLQDQPELMETLGRLIADRLEASLKTMEEKQYLQTAVERGELSLGVQVDERPTQRDVTVVAIECKPGGKMIDICGIGVPRAGVSVQ